jgi:carboxymethylenebutenolidase
MRITLPTGTPAELATPASGSSTDDSTTGAARGLVLLPDIMGLRPLFDEHVAKLAAEQGWVVCAPEPFPGFEDKPLDWRMDHAGEVSDQRRLDDALAAADATGCDVVGVLGFCMGGMFALEAAGTGRFDHAVAFYGMIRTPEAWRSEGFLEPLDAVTAPGACPVLLIAGTEDPYTPPDDLAALEATGAQVVVYDGAQHGFVHDASRPTHRAEDAADAWRRAIAFLTS